MKFQADKRVLEKILDEHLCVLVKYNKSTKAPGINKLSEITSKLFMSNYDNMINYNLLKENGIKNIIYFGDRVIDQKKFKAYKINYFHIKDDIIPQIFDKAYNIMETVLNKEMKLLLVCDSGISNMVIVFYMINRFYLLTYKSGYNETLKLLDLEQSQILMILKFLKESRPCIDITPEQFLYLLKIEYNFKKYYLDQLLIEIENVGYHEDNDSELDELESLMDEIIIDDIIVGYLKKIFNYNNLQQTKTHDKNEEENEYLKIDKLEDLDEIL